MGALRGRFSPNPGYPMTGAQAELVIQDLLEDLEDLIDAHARAQTAARKAEAEFRREYARLFLTADVKAEGQRAQYAQYHAADLFDKRADAEADAAAIAETCRIRRSQLDGLQSLIASARAAEHGR